MSLKTEELLGTYSTKQLAIYLRFNNFDLIGGNGRKGRAAREAFEKLLSFINGARTTRRRGSGGV